MHSIYRTAEVDGLRLTGRGGSGTGVFGSTTNGMIEDVNSRCTSTADISNVAKAFGDDQG